MIDGLKKDIMINTINTNIMKMKMKTILLVTLIALSFGSKSIAQSDNDCVVTLSLFVEPAKAKNYDAALPHYDKVVNDCPSYSIATYQYAARMFKHYIKGGDKSKVKDLIKAYQYQMQYFPNKIKKGKTLSTIAQINYDNKIGTMQDQFDSFDEAYKLDAETFTSPKSLYTYFSLAKDLFDAGNKDVQEVFNLYDIVYEKIEKEEIKLASMLTQLIDKQESGTKLTSKEEKRLKASEKNLKAYGTVKGSVDGKLGIIADCPNLIPLYERDFEANKNDVSWLKKSAGRLSSKECDTDLFFQMVQQLHTLEPSAKSAYYLGILASKDGKMTEARNYFNQSAELETNPSDKAKVYYKIAENYRKGGQYGKARSYYRKALDNKPSFGSCYLKIAQMYAKSSNGCGTTVFEKRSVNWLAAQMAEKAARVDASIASNARAAASSYRQRAPSKSDIFSEGMAGKTITFNCWVGGSVKVPNL
jgi:tetratricopeptide (TPR) repeat protein